MKKIIAFLLSFVFLANTCKAFAEETTHPIVTSVNAFSAEYPNAYLDAKVISEVQSPEQDVITVEVTAYIEEKDEEIDGKIVRSSRLLSRNDINRIGINNFSPISPDHASIQSNTGSAARGTLTISMSYIRIKETSTQSEYSVVGQASWSGFDTIYSSYNNPANGLDYLGLTWGGGFANTGTGASAKLSTGASTTITLCDSTPNQSLVYSFYEKQRIGAADLYVKPATIYTTLYKNSLEGSGNTTSAVLKYIHTYTAIQGSISISPGSGAGAGSFSLSGVSDQWSIACYVDSLYY